jgi:2-C-methyl-D-erythritol 4-phosphate cytidylyltransferase
MRAAGGPKKQYRLLNNLPVLTRTLLPFGSCTKIEALRLVVPKTDFPYCEKHILPQFDRSFAGRITLVPGGGIRMESVWNGLVSLPRDTDIVVVHDGVRPFVTPEQITACVETARTHAACLLAVPLGETLKRVGEGGIIEKTLSREALWCAQTPQAFSHALLLRAYETAQAKGDSATDEAALVERLGHPVRIIRGSPVNIKITTPDDLILAAALSRHLPPQSPREAESS